MLKATDKIKKLSVKPQLSVLNDRKGRDFPC